MKIGILEQSGEDGGGGGSFAVLSDFTDSIATNTGSTRAHTCPNNVVAGNLILAFFAGGDPSAIIEGAPPAGWVSINESFFYKLAVGGESGTNVTFNLDEPLDVDTICVMCRASLNSTVIAPEASAIEQVSSVTTIDPSTFNPSMGAGNNLWISALWSYGSANALVTRPTGYSLYQHGYTGAGSNGYIQIAAKQSVLATENPGPWVMSDTDLLRTTTVVVRGA